MFLLFTKFENNWIDMGMDSVKNHKLGFKTRQLGFSFIEMVIAIIMIGILAMTLVMFIGGGMTSSARADAMFDMTSKMASNWALLCKEAGASNSLGTTTVPGTGNTSVILASGSSASNVLRYGRTHVASGFQNAYDRSGIVPMPDAMSGGTAWGGQKVFGYTTYILGNGTGGVAGGMLGPFALHFTGVSDEVVLQLVKKYGSGVSALAAGGDASHAVIEYGAGGTTGQRNVSIIKYI